MYTLVRDEIGRKTDHFAIFQSLYFDALDQFIHVVKVLNTGLVFQPAMMLYLRDNLFGYLENDEQMIDYLYRLPATNTQMTYTHCFNAGLLTYLFGKWCNVEKNTLDELTIAGFLYDCGLTKIDTNLLEKKEPLSISERLYINQHVTFSYEMLKTQKMPKICKLILTHHEKKDGSGYPMKLYGDRVTSYSTLLSLADQFEALTHIRSYRYSLTPMYAIEFMELCGLERFSYLTASSVLFRVAATYLGHEVVLSNGTVGKISKIHKDCIGRPVVYTPDEYIDLKERNDLNIVFM